jgi:hypothetical protein
MGIAVNYAPSFDIVGEVAQQAGYGQYLQKQDAISREQQQQAIQNEMQNRRFQAEQQGQNNRLQYQGYRDAIDDRQKTAQLGVERQNKLDTLRWQDSKDKRDFQQGQFRQDQGFQNDVALANHRAQLQEQAKLDAIARKQKEEDDATSFEHPPEVQDKLRQLEAFQQKVNQDSTWETDEERMRLNQAETERLFPQGVPEKVPVNREMQKQMKMRMVTIDGRKFFAEGSMDNPRLRPIEALGADPEVVKVEAEKKKAEQKIEADAQKNWQKAQTVFRTDDQRYSHDRNKWIADRVNDARRDAMEQARVENFGKKDKEGKPLPLNVAIDSAKIKEEAAKEYDALFSENKPVPPNRADHFPWEVAQQAGGMAAGQLMRGLQQPVPPPPPPGKHPAIIGESTIVPNQGPNRVMLRIDPSLLTAEEKRRLDELPEDLRVVMGTSKGPSYEYDRDAATLILGGQPMVPPNPTVQPGPSATPPAMAGSQFFPRQSPEPEARKLPQLPTSVPKLLPENHPAHWQHKTTREQFVKSFGGSDALDEDALSMAYHNAEMRGPGERVKFDKELRTAIDMVKRNANGKLTSEEKKNFEQYANLYLQFIRKG